MTLESPSSLLWNGNKYYNCIVCIIQSLLSRFFPIILLIFVVSCHHDDSPWGDFFDEMDQTVNADVRKQFRDSLLDSSGLSTPTIIKYVGQLLAEPSHLNDFHLHLDSLAEGSDAQVEISAIAYHQYCNGERVTDLSVMSDYKRILEYRWQQSNVVRRAGQRRIAELNDSRISVGDVVCVSFVTKEDMCGQSAYYDHDSSSVAFDLENLDRLAIRGKVIAKTPIRYHGQESAIEDLVFSIKVFDVNNNNIMLNQKQLGAGDTLALHVWLYGKRIAKCA